MFFCYLLRNLIKMGLIIQICTVFGDNSSHTGTVFSIMQCFRWINVEQQPARS